MRAKSVSSNILPDLINMAGKRHAMLVIRLKIKIRQSINCFGLSFNIDNFITFLTVQREE